MDYPALGMRRGVVSEADAVAQSREPVTRAALAHMLRQLHLEAGHVALAHTSLSALGWVCGGAAAVIEALLEALGPGGTLAMPAYSADLSEPSNWMNPPVPAAWWPRIRESMPAFEARCTPTRRMGVVAELFRTWPGVVRSEHPTSSIAACGAQAAFVIDGHPLDDPMGEGSPLARLHALDARVVLLGVGHDRNTALHLAERRAFGALQARIATGSPVRLGGERQWVAYREPLACSDDFEALGEAFEAQGSVARLGAIRVMRMRALVDFGTAWLRSHRAADGFITA
jgi:aminoglycoside 3-N-acetyltransferase